tara:strand:+ start:639 stop:809 length:171 start_codon:yes stop_codon:yes gene_type:complete
MFVYFTTVIKALSFLRETEKPFLKNIWEGIQTFKKKSIRTWGIIHPVESVRHCSAQ